MLRLPSPVVVGGAGSLGGAGGGGRRVRLGEHHALAGLARVDPQHRADRERDVVVAPAKRARNARSSRCRGSAAGRGALTLSTILPSLTYWRGTSTPRRRIDDDVRRLAVVHHPVVHGAQQVRALRDLTRCIRSCRYQGASPARRRDRLARNAGREKIGSRTSRWAAPAAAGRSRSAAGATGSARWSRPPSKTRRTGSTA